MGCGRCRGSGWLLHTDAVGGEGCRSSGAEPLPCGCAAAAAAADADPGALSRLRDAAALTPRASAIAPEALVALFATGGPPLPPEEQARLSRLQSAPPLDLEALRASLRLVITRPDAERVLLQDRGGDAVRRRPYRPFGFGDR